MVRTVFTLVRLVFPERGFSGSEPRDVINSFMKPRNAFTPIVTGKSRPDGFSTWCDTVCMTYAKKKEKSRDILNKNKKENHTPTESFDIHSKNTECKINVPS